MAQKFFRATIATLAIVRGATGFPFFVRIKHARLGMKNGANPVELPTEGVAQLDVAVVFPTAVFVCLILGVVIRGVILGMIG